MKDVCFTASSWRINFYWTILCVALGIFTVCLLWIPERYYAVNHPSPIISGKKGKSRFDETAPDNGVKSQTHKKNEIISPAPPSNVRDLLRKNYNIFPAGVGTDDSRNGDKYFIYRCDGSSLCGGWGDRIKGILAAYIIANITGRTFKAEIKTKNCDLLSLVVPNFVNWSLPTSIHNSVKQSKDVYHMNMVGNLEFYNTLDQIDFNQHKAMMYKYVYFKGNLDYMDAFKASKFHQDKLSWMSNLTRDQITSVLFRRLIKLAKGTQAKLDQFMDTVLKHPTDKLVCAHIRMGRNPSIPHDTELRNVPEVLPKVWQFLNNFTNQENYIFFVTSDSESVITDAKRQRFGKELHAVPGTIQHIERSTNSDAPSFKDSLEKLVAEQFILMRCDILMISKSGFSRLAAYVRGSNEGMYCLIKGSIIPCKLHTFGKLYNL